MRFVIDENELEDSLRVCREIEDFKITDDLAMQNQLSGRDLFQNKTLQEVDKVLNGSWEEKTAEEPAPGREVSPGPDRESGQAEMQLSEPEPAGELAEEPQPVSKEPVKKVSVAKPVYASGTESGAQEEYAESHPFLRTLLGILICIVTALVLSLVITRYVAYHTSVEGSSMEPAFQNGDQLIVEKLSYYFHEPERYDVVVFPFSENVSYIKRIIGLPGDIIQIKNGEVYLNGEVMGEKFGKEERIADPGLADEEIVLAEDEYFVLGDNRNASRDSRFEEVGTIRRSQIEGKAWVRFYPFDEISTVH